MLRYDRGWSALNKLLRAGRSFSGRERNCCFLNMGGGQFANVSAATGLDLIHDGRGLAVTDWDADGDLDLWITSRTGPRARFLRNDVESGNAFVSLRLQGQACNRDAIGARVTLYRTPDDKQPLIRTLYAGHGYLSQSSKTIHFGLGTAGQIDRLVIRWPGSPDAETIRGLEPNRHYRIVQSRGKAEPIEPGRPTTHLAAATPSENIGTDKARVVVLGPPQLPDIEYVDADGNTRLLETQFGKPLLVNLWATWCTPCLAELKEWADHEEELRQAGVEILALCVDEPTDDLNLRADLSKASELAAKLGYRFSLGVPSTETVELLDIVQRTIVAKQRPLQIPASFLLDAQGRLAVIYRGPVAVQQLLADIDLLEAAPQQIVAGAIPFDGRWYQQPASTPHNAIATALIDGGKSELAITHLSQLIASYEQNLPRADDQARPKIESALASALETSGRLRFDQQDYEGALQAYHKSLDVMPRRRGVHQELAYTYSLLKQPRKVAEQLTELLEIRRDDPENLTRLGMLKFGFGELAEARALVEEAIELQPTAAHQHGMLARILLAAGDGAGAVAEFEQTLRLRPQWASAENDLAWVLATHADSEIRDGARAIALAADANRRLEDKHPGYLDTLAAAYAETGRYAEAVETASRALEIAQDSRNQSLIDKLEKRLELYRSQRPYRAFGRM